MPEDFVVYKAENLRKVNSQRRAQSAPGNRSLPILSEGSVAFSSADEAHGEPRSCANCMMYNWERTCMILGRDVPVRKFIWPKSATADAKRIEYWPVCDYWIYGDPNYGPEEFHASIDPDNAGFGWINAPSVGQERGGSNCGGRNGGDECDLWVTEEADARDADFGFCRVLQKQTANLDCCTAWQDDDWLEWRTGVERLRELDDAEKEPNENARTAGA